MNGGLLLRYGLFCVLLSQVGCAKPVVTSRVVELATQIPSGQACAMEPLNVAIPKDGLRIRMRNDGLALLSMNEQDGVAMHQELYQLPGSGVEIRSWFVERELRSATIRLDGVESSQLSCFGGMPEQRINNMDYPPFRFSSLFSFTPDPADPKRTSVIRAGITSGDFRFFASFEPDGVVVVSGAMSDTTDLLIHSETDDENCRSSVFSLRENEASQRPDSAPEWACEQGEDGDMLFCTNIQTGEFSCGRIRESP